MRNTAIILILMAGLMKASAQTNPLPGYVITHQNDTINGIIDYRTDAKNAHSCMFLADGDSIITEYKPQDIKGYRIKDNGAYYVTKTFPVEGVEKTFFAEFLLSGNVSLYRHRENNTDYFYLVDQDGKIATLRETGDIPFYREDQIANQRKKVQEATQMFQNSQKTLQQLWTTPEITPTFLTKLIKEYNKECHPDAGESVVFNNLEKSPSKVNARVRFEAGVGINDMTVCPLRYWLSQLKITALSPFIGVGIDVVLPRVSKSLILQATAYYSYTKGHKEPDKIESYFRRELQYHDICLQLGAAYSFLPKKTISPIVRAGASLDLLMGMKTVRMEGYYDMNKHVQDKSGSFRYYAGLGAEMKVGSHKVSLTGNFVMRNFGTFGLRAPMYTINLGFIL